MTLFRRVLAEKRGAHLSARRAPSLVNAALFVAVVYPLSLKVANGERDAQAAARARAAAQAEFEAARATISGKSLRRRRAEEVLRRRAAAGSERGAPAARRKDRQAGRDRERQARTERRSTSTPERGSELGKLTATVVLDRASTATSGGSSTSSKRRRSSSILENVALSQGQERDRG